MAGADLQRPQASDHPRRGASALAVAAPFAESLGFGSRRSPAAVKAPKARTADSCHRLEDLPNIGPAMAADLRALGITHPRELAHRDAFVLYQALCALSGKRQDPCVLDTFMAATDFVRGAAPAPWWAYTAQRKLLYGTV